MLPTINNKSFLECNEEDLKVLIENPDYRENEYIDYKQNFSFLEVPKVYKDLIAQKKVSLEVMYALFQMLKVDILYTA